MWLVTIYPAYLLPYSATAKFECLEDMLSPLIVEDNARCGMEAICANDSLGLLTDPGFDDVTFGPLFMVAAFILRVLYIVNGEFMQETMIHVARGTREFVASKMTRFKSSKVSAHDPACPTSRSTEDWLEKANFVEGRPTKVHPSSRTCRRPPGQKSATRRCDRG